MDRIINVKVGGNHLSKDNKYAGVKGEANVTKLRITFDSGWDGFAKTVTFFDAYGNNPVKRIQGVDLIEDIVNDRRTYITPIPKEPLAFAGELTFIIDGYFDGKRQRSIADKLVVKEAPDTDNAEEPTDPTPTPSEQFQAQFEAILDDIHQSAVSAQNAEVSARNAEESAEEALEYKNQAVSESIKAKGYAEEAEGYAGDATTAANKAENAIKHNPIIVDGYWHIWSAQSEEYINTEIKAQAGSTVYMGDNPPADADVWLDPEGDESPTSNASAPSYAFINILGGADNWEAEDVTDASGNVIGTRYGQVVNVNNAVITKYSKVDLQITSEQLVVFYQKDIAFVAENEDGVVTVYAVGSIPENDYRIQAIVTEVSVDG